MIILDTSALIALQRGNIEIREKLSAVQRTHSGQVAIAAPTVWEYLVGILSVRSKIEGDILQDLRHYRILHTTETSCIQFARLKLSLKGQGKMVPEMDILIAAIALTAECPVVTRDAHFTNIKELTVITI